MELRSTDQNKEGKGKGWCKVVYEVYIGPLSQNNVYMLVHRTKMVYTYTCTPTRGKMHTCWKTKVLVWGIWSKVFLSKVFGTCWKTKVLVRGIFFSKVFVQHIWSEVLTLVIWSKVLVLSAFGLKYWQSI